MNSFTGSSTSAAAGQLGSPLNNALQPAGHMAVFAAGAILFASIFGGAMYLYAAPITGPFIFGDEPEYFLFGHDLSTGTNLSSHAQYGIFYPFIEAIFFHFGDAGSVYQWLRAFNVVVFASSIVPVFLLARALFPRDRILWFLLSVFAATTSFSAYTDLIWAEPLYFMLFQWLVFSLFVFYQRPQIATACIVGTLLALLFHAKPGAGLVVDVAAVISLAMMFNDGARRPYRWTVLAAILTLVCVCGMLTIPWIVRNLSIGAGVIGYQGPAQNLKTLIAEIGAFEVVKRTFLSVFYQLSYFFVATWGLLGVLAVTPLLRWKALPTNVRMLAVFLAACSAGLIALVALGSNADPGGQEYWMPFGRYFSMLCPTIVILSIGLLRSNLSVERREKRYLIAVTAILAVMTACATPLLAIVPRSIVNASDLALAMAVVDKGHVIWRHVYEPALFERVAFAALFAFFGLIGILTAQRRNFFYGFVVLMLLASLIDSLAELRYMRMLGASQSATNDAIRFLREQGVDFEHAVAIDRSLEESPIGFFVAFWNTSRFPLRYVPAEEFDHTRDGDLKYFLSPKVLALPIEFNAPGIHVYRLKG